MNAAIRPTRRLMIYHHFDRDAIIDDYVVDQLSAYHAIPSDILFISNSPITPAEQAKVQPSVQEIIVRPNRGFDWGAWAELIATRGDALLASYDELILTNCTCYGPLFPFAGQLEKMSQSAADFWSLTFYPQGLGIPAHGQSYFLGFKSQVFNAPVFRTFFKNLSGITGYWDAVWKGEIALYAHLIAAHFTYASMIEPLTSTASAKTDVTAFPVAEELLSARQIPLLKVKALLNHPHPDAFLADLPAWLLRAGSTYPSALIQNHLRRLIAHAQPAPEPSCLSRWTRAMTGFISQQLIQRFPTIRDGLIVLRCKRYGIPTAHIHRTDL